MRTERSSDGGLVPMRVVGIDVSTFSVDLVAVPLDDGPPQWTRCVLEHDGDAFDRTRQAPLVVPGPAHSYWDDVLAVGIEEPAGRNTGYAFRVQGIVLGCIPREKLVTKFMPSEWRKAVAMPGNASKGLVKATATETAIRTWGVNDGLQYPGWIDEWPQDAWDAYCIALATRNALERRQAA